MRAPLWLLASSVALGCTHPAYDVATSASRTLQVAGDPSMRAVPFPPRAKVHPARPPLIVVEPILWRRELLLREGGLVAWLEDEGFPVWLVGTDSPRAPDARTLAAGVAQAVAAVARGTGAERVDVLATGLSGGATLQALEPLTAPGSGVRVGRVAFLGAPLDLAYPGSFVSRVTTSTTAFHDRGAVAWLGGTPVQGPSESRPARERYPFAARLGEVPVLFVAGKVDGIAPSESVFPVFALWGSEAKDPRAVTKGFFLAGRENGLAGDADAFDLVSGGAIAVGAWERVEAFLTE